MKRELTGHVVTRWYRAPEIILLEKDYGPAFDIWAVGCIFAELLRRKPFLPGTNTKNQLELIFEYLGTPTDEEINAIPREKYRNRYVPKYFVSNVMFSSWWVVQCAK